MMRALVGIGMLALCSAVARAQDFRVESQVYLASDNEPVAHTLTLFHNGTVYDFYLLPDERDVVIYEPNQSRFVLLDRVRRVKTIVTTDDIQQFTTGLRERLETRRDYGLLDADLSETYDPDGGGLTLSGPRVTYRVKGIAPKYETVAGRYRRFADWSARLNSMQPGGFPPFARLRLNEALARQGLIPVQIERTVASGSLAGTRAVVHSRHEATWMLSNSDRERVHAAGQYMAQFKAVSFREFFEDRAQAGT